jgi:hypothetical protein
VQALGYTVIGVDLSVDQLRLRVVAGGWLALHRRARPGTRAPASQT